MMAKIESSVKNEALKLRKSSEQDKKINRWTTCWGKNEDLWDHSPGGCGEGRAGRGGGGEARRRQRRQRK